MSDQLREAQENGNEMERLLGGDASSPGGPLAFVQVELGATSVLDVHGASVASTGKESTGKDDIITGKDEISVVSTNKGFDGLDAGFDGFDKIDGEIQAQSPDDADRILNEEQKKNESAKELVPEASDSSAEKKGTQVSTQTDDTSGKDSTETSGADTTETSTTDSTETSKDTTGKTTKDTAESTAVTQESTQETTQDSTQDSAQTKDVTEGTTSLMQANDNTEQGKANDKANNNTQANTDPQLMPKGNQIALLRRKGILNTKRCLNVAAAQRENLRFGGCKDPGNTNLSNTNLKSMKL
jgi:hypothetical protein